MIDFGSSLIEVFKPVFTNAIRTNVVRARFTRLIHIAYRVSLGASTHHCPLLSYVNK